MPTDDNPSAPDGATLTDELRDAEAKAAARVTVTLARLRDTAAHQYDSGDYDGLHLMVVARKASGALAELAHARLMTRLAAKIEAGARAGSDS